MRLSAIRCSRKRRVQSWLLLAARYRTALLERKCGKEALDICVEHPIHLFPHESGVKGVQRIVLAAPRPEPIGKAKKVRLVDGLQNVHGRLLDDFVLQAQNIQGTLRAVRLRDVGPFGRAGGAAFRSRAWKLCFRRSTVM